MNFQKRIVLASRSPRRVKLFGQIGLRVDVMPSEVEEQFDPGQSAVGNARSLALQKANDIARKCDDAIVVGADTIVELDGELLGKPGSKEEAIQMLERLSGRTHTVITGIALVDRPSGRSVVDEEITRVVFRTLPAHEIAAYVAAGSPMDKAGAYGIQDDYGAVFVTRVEGCFYNVVGFPLARFYTRLQELLSVIAKDERAI